MSVMDSQKKQKTIIFLSLTRGNFFCLRFGLDDMINFLLSKHVFVLSKLVSKVACFFMDLGFVLVHKNA